MATKSTGAELKAFYSDPLFWPENTYHEDEEIIVNGTVRGLDDDILDIPGDANVVVKGGIILDLPGVNAENAPSFEGHFKKWRKQQSTAFFVGECPKNILNDVLAAIVSAGGKVK